VTLRRVAPFLIALAAGVGVALSLPPLDQWWTAPVGYAVFAASLLDTSVKRRLSLAAAFNLGFFAVGLAWMVEFSIPGLVLLVLLEAGLATAALLVVPRSPMAALVAFPAAITLGEALRYRVPLGGLPMAGAALGQVTGPLLPLARVGGDYAVVFAAALMGAAIAALVVGSRRVGVAAIAVLVVAVAGSTTVDAPRRGDAIRVAYAQGGGVRGLRAVDNEATDTYGNQVEAMEKLRTPVDLVVWPEDVIDLDGPIERDPLRFQMGALATRLNATVVAGVVEDFKTDQFKNAAVAWDRSGRIVDRYDKVHRVPFGEYVPARGLVEHLGDFSPVPRDAAPGRGPGLLMTRGVDLGVMISYEVFFPELARTAVRAGGEILLVPTNASSFNGRQVPAQEIAAARLRAVETGRDLVQAAPTGYSAFVNANGDVSRQSRLGRREIATTTLHKRSGLTPFDRFGDRPMIGLIAFVLVGAAFLNRRGLDRMVKNNK
jgi:apolipoprotein N-acyltransferase